MTGTARHRHVLLAAALVAALGYACAEQTGPGSLFGRFSIAPVFTSESAGIVPVTAARFVLRRTADGVVVKDTVFALGTNADSVDLTLTVPLLTVGETFALTIAVVGTAGDTVFRGGPVTVTPATGGEAPPAISVSLVYTGVGADAAGVVILSPDTSLFFGEAVTLVAEARDSTGQPIVGTPIKWRSLDTARVRVPAPDSGRVAGNTQRGIARIVARLLTDQADTVRVTAQPVPTQLLVDAGGGQIGLPGAALEQPLVARVLAADALGVAGVWVRFAVTAGGGTLGNGNPVDSALTGADGRAQVFLTLGLAGPQVVEATTARLPNLTAIFAATAVVVGQIVFAGDVAFTNAALLRVNSDAQALTSVLALPNFQGNNRFHPRWAPDRSRIAYGVDFFPGPNELHVASPDGAEQALVMNDTSAQFPRWSRNGTHLAFQCGAVFGSPSLQDVCVVPNVNRPILQLDALGNGAYDGSKGKVFVTDFDTRFWPSGEGAFAWDPTDDNVIAFVRDSNDVSGLPGSMIFTSQFDGSNPKPLVPSGGFFDAGNGPLRIVSTMYWSEDGAFVVFAGLNRQGEQGLYLVNRDGTGLRQLTGGATDERPVISPDGKQVFFLRTVLGLANFYRVDVASTAVTQVGTDDFGDFDLTRLGFDYSPNGAEIAIAAWDTPFGNLRIYRIFPTTEAATYASDRLPIGRTPPVREFQPSWRP